MLQKCSKHQIFENENNKMTCTKNLIGDSFGYCLLQFSSVQFRILSYPKTWSEFARLWCSLFCMGVKVFLNWRDYFSVQVWFGRLY